MRKMELLEYAKLHYSTDEVARLEAAIDFTCQKHAGQKRLSGEPYSTHPLTVAKTLADWQMDITTVIAGVLHDTLEDTDTSAKELEAQFGEDVTFLVEGVSHVNEARSGMAEISSYLPQTKDNLSKLLIAVSHDLRVLIIKLADRLHNLKTLKFLPPEKQHKIAQESLEVFAPLADRLGMGKVRVELEELSFSYLQPEDFNKTEKILKKKIGRNFAGLEKIRQEVDQKLSDSGIIHEIDGRMKSTYSLYKKLKKVDNDIDQVYDLMALRIIVPRKEDCYQVLGILHSMYQPMLQKIKDYIAAPKPNGYQSLHTTVLTPSSQIVEFQIRSQEMHDLAEKGLAASFHYNEQKLTKNYTRRKVASTLPRNLSWISELQNLTEKIMAGEAINAGDLSVDLFSDRIFVYSPKGDIFDLPEGAFPLDFAFAVHTEMAKHTLTVKVNGKIHPFDKPLHNGDIVEVETRSNIMPKPDWLEHAKTAKARQKIRQSLKKTSS